MAPGEDSITAGDISRALNVDLKTVHRWVSRGALRGRRTRGGHLRFRHIEVIRFLRGRRLRVPDELRLLAPRSLALGVPLTLEAGTVTQASGSLFDVALVLAAGEHEILALDLDSLPVDDTLAFVQALRRHPATQSVAVIGVTRWPDRRQALLTAGADVIVGTNREVVAAMSYVTGEPVVLVAPSPELPRAATA